MPIPFRNTDKALGPLMLAPSVVSIFDVIEDAEAAVQSLDDAGFGEDLIYGRGESARQGVETRNQGWTVRIYRALQAVMSDELAETQRYEEKIDAGSSFILVPLSDANEIDRVADILRAHHVTLAHFLGRTGFRSL